MAEHTVGDRDFRVLLGEDTGGHNGKIPLDTLARVLDGLAGLALDGGHVGPVDQVGEQGNELLPLMIRPEGGRNSRPARGPHAAPPPKAYHAGAGEVPSTTRLRRYCEEFTSASARLMASDTTSVTGRK
jgi:hypothetical protein